MKIVTDSKGDQREKRINQIFTQIQDMLEKENIKEYLVTSLTYCKDDDPSSAGIVTCFSRGRFALMVSETLKSYHHKDPEETLKIIQELLTNLYKWYDFFDKEKGIIH